MEVFSLEAEQQFDAKRHVEKILGELGGGDYTVACWEPGQFSPNHCHPDATEIYFCFSGGGTMRTPTRTVPVTPGSFVVHPPGEVHEYENGPARTLLFRVRYGDDMLSRHVAWRGHPEWKQSPEDAAYFRAHPVGSQANG
jgi:quercetin dioxygenase-like cupin family protein